MIDRYTKAVLTVIALALVAIAIEGAIPRVISTGGGPPLIIMTRP